MKKKVLVTGSSGFIGSSLVGELTKLNYDVYCLDKTNYKRNKNKNIKTLNLDIIDLNPSKIPNNFTYIFHLAAELGVAHTINNSDTLLINNLITTRKIIEIAKNQKLLKRIFFASTSEIYDHSKDLINLCCKKLNFKGKLIFREVKNNSPKSRKPSINRIKKLSKKKIIFKSLKQGINEILTD